MGKSERITIRLDERFHKGLHDVADQIGVDVAMLARAAIEAVVLHVEEHGSIRIPIQFASDAEPELRAADAKAGYRKKPGEKKKK